MGTNDGHHGEPRPAEDRETWLRRMIATHGWAIQHVGAGEQIDEVAFSYTVGLTGLGHPELVMQGIPFEAAQRFLNLAGQQIADGYRFEAGTLDHSLSDSPVAVIDAEDTRELVAVEIIYERVRAMQLIWPDSTGKLPWEAGHRNRPEVQPFLGTLPSDWQDRPYDEA